MWTLSNLIQWGIQINICSCLYCQTVKGIITLLSVVTLILINLSRFEKQDSISEKEENPLSLLFKWCCQSSVLGGENLNQDNCTCSNKDRSCINACTMTLIPYFLITSRFAIDAIWMHLWCTWMHLCYDRCNGFMLPRVL